MADTQPKGTEFFNILGVPRYAPRLEPTSVPQALWNDEPTRCLRVNDEWVSHILGVLVALDQQDTWLGSDDEIYSARQQVNEIMLALLESCDPMTACCPIPLQRMTPEGVIEVSYDDGATWNPSTTEDPRKTGVQLPPLPTTGTATGDKCRAANNVTRQFKDAETDFANSLGAGLSVLQLALAFAAGIVILFLTAGTTAYVVVPALLALAAALVGTGHDAYNDLFDSDVWDYVLCTVYCHAQDDGTFTNSDFLNIRSAFDAHFVGNVALTFSSTLNAWQVDGLNQAAKTPSTDNASCEECDCGGDCPSDWAVFGDEPTHFHGEIIGSGDGYIDVQSGLTEKCYILIRTPDNTQGCVVTELEILSGAGGWDSGGSYTGETITEGAPNHFPSDIVASASCMAYFQMESIAHTPYIVRIHFIHC